MSLRYHSAGVTRPHEVTPRSHRRDAAWRAQVWGTRIEPMRDERGLWARIWGFVR